MNATGKSPSQFSPDQIVKSQIIEVPVTTVMSQIGKFVFPTQDFLRQKYIVGIEVFTVEDMPLSPLSGFAVITTANLQNSFLSLYEQNPELTDAQGLGSTGQGLSIENYPLICLHRVQNSATSPFVRALPIFTPRIVQWEKSYIQLANGALLTNAAAVSFVLNVFYIGNGGDSNGS